MESCLEPRRRDGRGPLSDSLPHDRDNLGPRTRPGAVLHVVRHVLRRRRQVRAAEPNAAHRALLELEQAYEVHVITQNVDDLHERAGSTNVLHLHGEIMIARSTRNPRIARHLGTADIHLGDTCPLGSQLRPHVVWFGEEVPALPEAARLVSQADIFLCVGTSLQVYPANSLVFATRRTARRIVIDPEVPDLLPHDVCECIAEPASTGVPAVVARLLEQAGGEPVTRRSV